MQDMMRSAVTDYLLNLKISDLTTVAIDYLGWDRNDVTEAVALQWVEGLSDTDVISIYTEMKGA
tara:strand:- start:1421 stop:1612 length:192 start_codon:yes stop_codon:yes gene_type:complete